MAESHTGERFRLQWSDLIRWAGEIDRGPYVLWGLILFFLKFNLNKYIALIVGLPQLPAYTLPATGSLIRDFWFFPHGIQFRLATLLVLISLPFIWAGVVLTIRRLRSLNAPLWLCLLFFVPGINYLFFIVLSVLPGVSRVASAGVYQRGRPDETFLRKVIPLNPWGASLMAIAVTAFLGTALIYVASSLLASYKGGLFIGVPFIVGFTAVMLLSVHAERTYKQCLGIAWTSTLCVGLFLLGFAIEGVLCLAMAAPLAAVLAFMGASLAYYLQKESWRKGQNQSRSSLLLCLPLFLVLTVQEEAQDNGTPLQFAVTTSVEVDAPPAVVWKNVVEFPDLPPPSSGIFLTGIAYPVGARIEGEGVGAIRYCRFSTGSFVEPIEVWEPPRLLKFSVTETPPPMEEWTPYRYLHPPHLENFFVSDAGQFLLVPLDGGRTRVEGTTWYRNRIAPSWYWKLFSDEIIHRIHLRVLNHVKAVAED